MRAGEGLGRGAAGPRVGGLEDRAGAGHRAGAADPALPSAGRRHGQSPHASDSLPGLGGRDFGLCPYSPRGRVDPGLARDGVRQMRWTGSAIRLFGIVAGVLLAMSTTAPAGMAVELAVLVRGERLGSMWCSLGTRCGASPHELGDPFPWPAIAAVSASIVQPRGVRLGDPDLIHRVNVAARGGALSVVSGVSGATDVSVGWDHSCAVVTGGKVVCWDNDHGQTVSGVSGATEAVTARDRPYLCAGNGGEGGLLGGDGAGKLGDRLDRGGFWPEAVSGVSGATAIAAGDAHNVRVITGGRVTCWGSNFSGVLGDGTTKDSPIPVIIPRSLMLLMWQRTGIHLRGDRRRLSH